MSKQKADASSALKNFMSAMFHWEESFHCEQIKLIEIGLDTSESEAKYRAQLAHIFESFSAPDQKGWARLVDLGCGSPPTYDPARDDIAAPVLSGNTYTIVVQQAARFKATYQFHLKLLDGAYKIIKKETQNGGKWKKTAL
ncbi:NTF2 fold immunity protein [Pseudomonas syringae pv. actinidifoliorum]|nr:NTF2 fold immunity protein [Pseudomonas syringae pv. actinidifoliorum]MDU8524416.1 NTF2 fold immunity protein [Pseudomonas syringae pv. actinidifoliorum]MDU8527290.1 NTF2 fold immunity protein [Pseudomonas syringae pv. actinidifoliorum]